MACQLAREQARGCHPPLKARLVGTAAGQKQALRSLDHRPHAWQPTGTSQAHGCQRPGFRQGGGDRVLRTRQSARRSCAGDVVRHPDGVRSGPKSPTRTVSGLPVVRSLGTSLPQTQNVPSRAHLSPTGCRGLEHVSPTGAPACAPLEGLPSLSGLAQAAAGLWWFLGLEHGGDTSLAAAASVFLPFWWW